MGYLSSLQDSRVLQKAQGNSVGVLAVSIASESKVQLEGGRYTAYRAAREFQIPPTYFSDLTPPAAFHLPLFGVVSRLALPIPGT